MEDVKQRIKEHEGFRDTVYSDSLGFATIGYGHLVLPTDNFVEGVTYPKEQLEVLFDKDFQIALTSANELVDGLDLNHIAKPRVMKFKKMWAALRNNDFEEAANQMIDSAWHKQTTSRCESLASTMRGSNK